MFRAGCNRSQNLPAREKTYFLSNHRGHLEHSVCTVLLMYLDTNLAANTVVSMQWPWIKFTEGTVVSCPEAGIII